MIIAEIGLNHLGDDDYLMEYVGGLVNSSVDAVTLQVREEEFYNNTDFPNLVIPMNAYVAVSKIIKDSGKKFGIALSNLDYVSFFDGIVDFYKILSKDLGDDEFVSKFINVVDKPIFISTGLSSYEEIGSFLRKIDNEKKKNINLIHTRLSNKAEDTNLKAIERMKSSFDVPIAFGNHCQNPFVTYAAVAFEPSSIFLYVKGQRSDRHPDEDHAISLRKIANFCENINEIKSSIGTGNKQKTRNIIRGQK